MPVMTVFPRPEQVAPISYEACKYGVTVEVGKDRLTLVGNVKKILAVTDKFDLPHMVYKRGERISGLDKFRVL